VPTFGLPRISTCASPGCIPAAPAAARWSTRANTAAPAASTAACSRSTASVTEPVASTVQISAATGEQSPAASTTGMATNL